MAKIDRVGYKPPEDGLGERIKEKRKELNLNVEELASLTAMYDLVPDSDGVSPPTIYRYESDKSKPGAREIRLLSLALNVSPCWLITGEEWNQEDIYNTELAIAFRKLINMATSYDLYMHRQIDRDHKHTKFMNDIKIGEASVYESPPSDD